MNNLLALALLFSGAVYSQVKSINTKKVEYHQFKTFGKKKIRDGKVVVSGIRYSTSDQEYSDSGRRFKVPLAVFERARTLSQSVFRASPGDTGGHGTAFYVGGNLILTNQHVLSPKRTNTTKCKSFSIRLNSNQKSKTLYCKEVHYCNKNFDFCLIELKDHKRGYSITKETPLKLKKNSLYSPFMRTMVIGNPMGFGIHASTGIGTDLDNIYSPLMGRFRFYAPLFGGNSGGPIFNDQNDVIGIATAQSAELVSDKSYNVGLPMETVLNLLEVKLKNKPLILNQLNY